MSSLPPWATDHLLEPVQLDSGNQIDVTPYVRFETGFNDIDYGVLDVEVSFQQEGYPVHMYLLHYFALTERYDKNGNLPDGWRDQFDFPPALLKLVVIHQGRTINLFMQQCLAINDRGISVYGPNKGLRRRLIYHAIYYEKLLFDAWEAAAPSLTRNPLGSPHTTWYWARPQGINPRQAGRWVIRDHSRQAFDFPPAAAGSQHPGHASPVPPAAPAYRQMAREQRAPPSGHGHVSAGARYDCLFAGA